MTLVPKTPGRGDRKAFCGDGTGLIVFTTDATVPRLEDGLCDPLLPAVR